MQINLIAPPLYVITTNTLERTDGLTKLNEVLEQIKKVIEDNGGVFTIKMPVCLAKSQFCTCDLLVNAYEVKAELFWDEVLTMWHYTNLHTFRTFTDNTKVCFNSCIVMLPVASMSFMNLVNFQISDVLIKCFY